MDKYIESNRKRWDELARVHFESKFYNVEEFRKGMDIELEHGTIEKNTNVTDDNPLITGKITLAHLNEIRDYNTRLEEMERKAEEFWEKKE